MDAVHAFWSLPNRARNGGEIVLPDYELLTLMLSALTWRRLNGPIRLVTDSAGAAFFERAGLAGLWSEPPCTELDGMDASLDPRLFWAAGKLEALRRTSAPCVLLDADLILWSNVGALLTDGVVAAHREDLSPDVYPEPSVFSLDPGYAFPPEWDFSLPAANTAFLYLPDDGFKAYYTDEAFRFMCALRGGADPTVAMCFAEQRILPMCAAARGVSLRTLLRDPAEEQSFVTHLWGVKRRFAAAPGQRVAYCLSCAFRLAADFPAWAGALAENPQTRPYWESVQRS